MNSYDINEFDEVVRYADGICMYERRELTGYEEQLLKELEEMTTSYSNATAENGKLQAHVERLEAEMLHVRSLFAYTYDKGITPIGKAKAEGENT